MNLNGLKIGHAQDYNIKTGVTVFLLDKPSNCSYLVCGSAPALRDVSTLDLDTFVSKIDEEQLPIRVSTVPCAKALVSLNNV